MQSNSLEDEVAEFELLLQEHPRNGKYESFDAIVEVQIRFLSGAK